MRLKKKCIVSPYRKNIRSKGVKQALTVERQTAINIYNMIQRNSLESIDEKFGRWKYFNLQGLHEAINIFIKVKICIEVDPDSMLRSKELA